MLSPGTILQTRYLIKRRLGQGGMGTVYEATDKRLDITVALKECLFDSEELRKQFEREARLLAKLHHFALPKVSDHFTEGSGQYLVMQFIPGQDLEARLKGGVAFPIEQVTEWGLQLLDALDYLHTQTPPVIHRDIKPQNLKVGDRGHIALLDFGLAKGFAGQLSRITTSGSIFGYTPNYAPLEQIHGTGTDSRSDLFSLAATLYHLLTGVIPPDVLTRLAATSEGLPDPLRAAHELSPSVPVEVAAVLKRTLSIGKSQRPSSAAEMKDMLYTAYRPLPGGIMAASSSAPLIAEPLDLAGTATIQDGTPDSGIATPQAPTSTVLDEVDSQDELDIGHEQARLAGGTDESVDTGAAHTIHFSAFDNKGDSLNQRAAAWAKGNKQPLVLGAAGLVAILIVGLIFVLVLRPAGEHNAQDKGLPAPPKEVVAGGSAANAAAASIFSLTDFNQKKDVYLKEASRSGAKIGGGADDLYVWVLVRNSLVLDAELSSASIAADVNRKVVTLRGSVSTSDLKTKAEAKVKSIGAVKGVKNLLRISER